MVNRNGNRRATAAWTGAGYAGLGAALFYILDPASGRRRRARLRDRAVHASHRARQTLGSVASDLAGRSHSLKPLVKRVASEPPADDGVLVERVRAQLGRWVSHPRSISVMAGNGRVTLAGPIVAAEAPRLLARVRRIPGVRDVLDALQPHEKTAGVPGLQGGTPRKGRRPELLQARWSPAFRMAGAAAGALLLARALGRKRAVPARWAWAASGAALLARAWFNEPFARILGLGGGPAAIRLQKSLHVDAPVDAVFRAFASYDNFPLYMPHVREVRDLGGGRSHWKVQALPGFAISVTWEAEITELVADRILAWTSQPGSLVPNEGKIRFNPDGKGGTAVDIRLGYHPPGGELGHAFAKLLGADPKRKLDRDLMILKAFIERHKAATAPA